MSVTFRTRADAAAWLSKKLGRKITVGSLHRMASDETGPRYVMLLGRASYLDEDLEAWVEQIIKAPTKRPRPTSLTSQQADDAEAPPAAA